jgi:hypothetical protein
MTQSRHAGRAIVEVGFKTQSYFAYLPVSCGVMSG